MTLPNEYGKTSRGGEKRPLPEPQNIAYQGNVYETHLGENHYNEHGNHDGGSAVSAISVRHPLKPIPGGPKRQRQLPGQQRTKAAWVPIFPVCGGHPAHLPPPAAYALSPPLSGSTQSTTSACLRSSRTHQTGPAGPKQRDYIWDPRQHNRRKGRAHTNQIPEDNPTT